MIDWRSESTAETVEYLRGVIDEVLPGRARVLLLGPDGRLWSAIDDYRPRPYGVDEGDARSLERTVPVEDVLRSLGTGPQPRLAAQAR